MKVKPLFLMMAFLACYGLRAQDTGGSRYLNLVLPDNSLVSYELTNGVDIHFQDSLMFVNDLSFYMEDLVKYYLSSEGSVQVSQFSSGWNWWSTYVEQEGIDGLQMLKDGLGTDGVTIRSQANGFDDYYEGYGWFGDLENLDNESSYRIKTNSPCTVEVSGELADPSLHPITINQGWNWIGFVSPDPIDINDAFVNLEPVQGDVVKHLQGFSEFYPGYGWYGSLSTLMPGMGLMYKSTNGQSLTFTYPSETRQGILKVNRTGEANHWVPDVHAYPDNMTITAVVDLDEEELSGENYELAAFVDGECRGSVGLMYVEPLGRYVAFLTVSGGVEEKLQFRLYDKTTGMEFADHEESITFVANAVFGQLDAPFSIHFRSSTGVNEWHNDNQIPNDENESDAGYVVGDKLYVRSAEKGFVVISDMLGRVVYNQKIGDVCVIDLNLLAPNTLYVIKVNNQTLKFIRR